MNFEIKHHHHELLIIGSGGSGLSAAIFARNSNINVAVISQDEPPKSNTIAAQGGINASLGNVTKDDWRWHAYDTIKSSVWLADQDSVEEMCSRAPEIIHMLDQLGVEFDRKADGKIDQKIYGGQSTYFGKGELAHRACYAKDKTGQTIMQKLYSEALKHDITFYKYNFALKLLIKNNRCYGLVTIDSKLGIVRIIRANNVVIATGGYSNIFANNTSAASSTGDGHALVVEAGIPLQDMEFVQFHPTALHGKGILITEAARSAGGILLNCHNERFMSKYAPKFMELAPRDIVARAIAQEIINGRGCGENGDYIYLDLRHMNQDEIKTKLPTIYQNCTQILSLDPSADLIPIAPAAHYTMGGIPTNRDCQVVRYANKVEIVISGLYAIGESACISVHGAGRLGCNSLLDLFVFAKKAIESIENIGYSLHEYDISEQDVIRDLKYIFADSKVSEEEETELTSLEKAIQMIMSKYIGVFRNQAGLELALKELGLIEKQFYKKRINWQSLGRSLGLSLASNTELIHYLKIKNMLISAKLTARSALWREESRGSHWREDFPNYSLVENSKFFGHTIIYDSKIDDHIYLRPVRMSKNNVDFYQPEQRNY